MNRSVGQVVSVLAFFFGNASLNPTEDFYFYCVKFA